MSSNKYLLFCTFLIVINCSGSKKNSESDSNEPTLVQVGSETSLAPKQWQVFVDCFNWKQARIKSTGRSAPTEMCSEQLEL